MSATNMRHREWRARSCRFIAPPMGRAVNRSGLRVRQVPATTAIPTFLSEVQALNARIDDIDAYSLVPISQGHQELS
jgi:hypothetical protein